MISSLGRKRRKKTKNSHFKSNSSRYVGVATFRLELVFFFSDTATELALVVVATTSTVAPGTSIGSSV